MRFIRNLKEKLKINHRYTKSMNNTIMGEICKKSLIGMNAFGLYLIGASSNSIDRKNDNNSVSFFGYFIEV